MMTSADLIELSGGIIATAGTFVALLKAGFCAREMPVWLRSWLFVAWALLGARLLSRDNAGVDPNAWWVAAIYLHTALVMSLAAIWAIVVTIGPGGDRCPTRPAIIPNVRERRWWIIGGVFVFLAAVVAVLTLWW